MSTLFDYYVTARATTGPQGYTGSNRSDAPAVVGWAAVKVDAFKATSSDFAAQAYTDGQGHFRISIRPSQTVGDWTSTNVAIGTGQWHPEFTDAIRFYGELILQIKKTPDGAKLSLDDIRAQIDGSAFSQGAGLLQAASKFWGTKGVGWDGPGAAAQMGNSSEITKLQQEFRAKGLTELQDNYEFKPGDFQMRQYTYVGGSASNIRGVEVYTDPRWQNLSAAADDVGWMAYMPTITNPEFIVHGDDGIAFMKAMQTLRAHSMDVIGTLEGFATPNATAAQQVVQQNLVKGLSASGYAEGSHHFESLGGSGMAFSVSVYRNADGQLVEVRVPGKWEAGSFNAQGAPISSVADGSGKIHVLGVRDPVDSTPEIVITASRIQDPPAGRDSANYITDIYANDHLAIVKAGGRLSDLWVMQKSADNGFADAKEFYAAVLDSNPGIIDVDQIKAGQTVYLPQKMADGSVTYHYAGGTSINSNASNGEYHMVTPNADGGHTVYSRKYVGDVDGPDGNLLAQYEVKQIHTNSAGLETLNYTGHQKGRDAEIVPVSASWQTDSERGSSTFQGDVRTDAVTNKSTGQTSIKVTDESNGQSTQLQVKPGDLSQSAYNDLMFSSMAGFLNALRGKDKLGMALHGAKMLVDTARFNNEGLVPADVLSGAGKSIAGLSATVGIVAGLRALQSHDLVTQLSGTVGLVSSTNALYSLINEGTGKTLLSASQLEMLSKAGAVLALANLRNLGSMLENGQVGSEALTVYQAWQGGAWLATSGATAGAAAGGAAAGATTVAPFNPALAVAMVVGAYLLDSIFASDPPPPPPPPPMGWADFGKDAQGRLVVQLHDTNDLGAGLLNSKMAEILKGLQKQLDEANTATADNARDLVLVASRLPKLYLQSWSSYSGNGETNYYYVVEQTHPQTGQKVYTQVARQDMANVYASLTALPEAVVQQWQADHLAAKFGADDAKSKLKAGLDEAGQQALAALKQMAVGSIDLATLKFSLADGSTLQAQDEQLKSDVLGTAVTVDSVTQNLTIMREKPYGTSADESVNADTWITLVQDMSVLQELQKSRISCERRTELRTLAQKYGLIPDAADFAQTLKSLVKGGENADGTSLLTRITDANVVACDVYSLDQIVKGNVRSTRSCVAKQYKVRRQTYGDVCPRLHHAVSMGIASSS